MKTTTLIKRFLICLAAILLAAGFMSFDKKKEVNETNVAEEIEKEPTFFVDEHPEEYLDDATWGLYAREVLAQTGKYVVTATVYNATVDQCDSSPLKTADGSTIDTLRLNNNELHWIAISRDLLKKGFRYGDKVIVSGNNKIAGIYELHDTMNPNVKNTIDILVPSHIRVGKWKNIIIERLEED